MLPLRPELVFAHQLTTLQHGAEFSEGVKWERQNRLGRRYRHFVGENAFYAARIPTGEYPSAASRREEAPTGANPSPEASRARFSPAAF